MDPSLDFPWEDDERSEAEASRPVRVAVLTRGLAVGLLAAVVAAAVAIEAAGARKRPGTPTRSTLIERNSSVVNLAFSPDGSELAVVHFGAPVTLWEVASRRMRLELATKRDVCDIAFAPGGRAVALAQWSDEVEIWDTASGEPLRPLVAPGRRIATVAYSPDGRTVAGGSIDGTLILWDVATSRIRCMRRESEFRPNALAFSPDGSTLATFETNGAIVLRDPHRGQVRARLPGHQQIRIRSFAGRFVSLAFSPDGKTLASACSFDPAIKVWDVGRGRLAFTLENATTVATYVMFPPGGRSLLSASHDGTIRSWDLRSRRSEILIDQLDHRYHRAAVSHDGAMLAIGELGKVTLCPCPATGTAASR